MAGTMLTTMTDERHLLLTFGWHVRGLHHCCMRRARRMQADPVGAAILAERPIVTSETLDTDKLRTCAQRHSILRVSSFDERAPILLWLGSTAAPTSFVFVIDGQEQVYSDAPFGVCHVQLLCFGISGLPHVLHQCRTLPYCVEPSVLTF